MAFAAAASLLLPTPVLCSASRSAMEKPAKKRPRAAAPGGFGRFAQVVRRDVDFLKKSIGRGFEWANDAFRLPQLGKTLDDLLWLRTVEDPDAPPPLPWPQPFYPELSGLDLFIADIKALEAYASYFYYFPKIWSGPLPESYDPEEVASYFNLRPHLVAFRLIEVFSSFILAAIRIRILGMWKLYRPDLPIDNNENISQYILGMVLKETMLDLGPTFIKVGQSLSTRPDIIGSEISKALSKLHDQIPPFPRVMAMKIIEEELGSPVEKFFNYITEEPVAAASFGQVYEGTTTDGHKVAVKVQRPNLQHVVVRDIYILRLGLGLLQKLAKRKSDPRLYADELGKGFVGELDYTLEAANANAFQEAHSSFPFIRVPKIFHHLSRKRVLTMEWIVGENPSDLILASTRGPADDGFSERQQQDARRRLLDLVSKGVEASLIQLLETGILHADPHAGNLRYTDAGEIGFLDFGLICRMEEKHQYAMLASIVHIVNGDWASLVRALSQMDVIKPGTNTWQVTMELEDALGEVDFKEGMPDVKFSRVLGKIWSLAIKYHFRMPAYYTLVLRSLASLEGLAVAADKNFKTFEAAYPYVVRKLLTDNSVASRRILYSAILNRKREFQWQRLALFLRVGATRKGVHQMITSDNKTQFESSSKGDSSVFDVADLILKLLPSKDGVVLRRLLMTVDGTSLIRSLVSKEAMFVRQQICWVIADIIYQWMVETIGRGIIASQRFQVRVVNASRIKEVDPSSAIHEYRTILRDRRLKVVFYKLSDSLRNCPALMVKFCWTSFVVFVTASALACHRVLVSLFEAYVRPVSVATSF